MAAVLHPLALLCLVCAAWALEPGQPAPAVLLPSAAGASWSLADQRGRWVVLEWVNFDCPFVQKHYRSGSMQRLQRTYREKGVVWASICSSAPGKQGSFAGETLEARLAEERWSASAYLIDADGQVGRAYDARTTPQLVVIDPAGTVVYWGAIDSVRSTDPADIPAAVNHLAAALDASLAGQAVPVPAIKPYGCSVKY